LLVLFSIGNYLVNSDVIVRTFKEAIVTVLNDEYRDCLYIGSVGAIYKVNRYNITEMQGEIKWPSPEEDAFVCRSLRKKENDWHCRNHVQVLEQLNQTHLYACGTASGDQTCCHIYAQNFTLMEDTCHFVPLRVPLIPNSQTYTQKTGENNQTVVTATFNGFYKNTEPYLSVVVGEKKKIKTEESRPLIFNKPHFAGLYVRPTIGGRKKTEKAYLFMNELAMEFNAHEYGASPYEDEFVQTSRVMSVCLNDHGGNPLYLAGRFVSMEKMSMVCSAKKVWLTPRKYGNEYLHFTHMVSTQLIENPKDESNPLVVALFKRANNEAGSGVCVFEFGDIQKKMKTNTYWKSRDDDRKGGPHVKDPTATEECPDRQVSERRMIFKESHVTKVGFIEPKWHRPIYHDPVEVFTSFRVAKTSDAAMMQLILGKTDGSIRRVLLHVANLFGTPDANQRTNGRPNLGAPATSQMADLVPEPHLSGEPVLRVVKLDRSFITNTKHHLRQHELLFCSDYRRNCTGCNGDPFCVWSREKDACTERGATSLDEGVPKCVVKNSSDITVEEKPVVEVKGSGASNISAEFKFLQSRSKSLQQDVDKCRKQLKHMKTYNAEQMDEMNRRLQLQNISNSMCRRNYRAYTERCAQVSSALLKRNSDLRRKLRIQNHQHEVSLDEVVRKMTAECESRSKSDMTSICDCQTNEVSQGYSFRENSTGVEYFVSEKLLDFASAKRFCSRTGGNLVRVTGRWSTYLRNGMSHVQPSWKYWVAYQARNSKKKTVSKCLQVSASITWKFVHCGKLAHPVCRKVSNEYIANTAMEAIRQVSQRQVERLN